MLKIYYSNETIENVSNYKKDVTKAIEETLNKEKVKENIEISLTFTSDNNINNSNTEKLAGLVLKWLGIIFIIFLVFAKIKKILLYLE